jgi:sodium/hydrogen exchanger-like protein 6/7/sodium/hydrogen exchanger 8
LLPIIIFKEGYGLDKKHFMKNIFYVILYGVFGSILNFIFVGLLTWAYFIIVSIPIEIDE